MYDDEHKYLKWSNVFHPKIETLKTIYTCKYSKAKNQKNVSHEKINEQQVKRRR